ncbi:restriction endonuclease subunit S [Barnesiella intestinihominis]|nr:restriction endonuclease subunit S [Barnesiella intestinihominis]MDB0677119.1 restriction endonuclease subunit S [Barnesiella intestinihominis]
MADNKDKKVLNVPALRFPEFSREWKRHKLSEICSFYSGGTPSSSKKEFYNGNIPFIRSGELHKDKTELFITEDGLNSSAAKLVEIGDLLLALYGATSGDIAISKIKGAINQAILCIRTKQNKKFIESVWNKHVERLLQTYLQGGQGNLSADIVKNIPFYFADLEEQDKLANFISLLDERISTQNKIIEDLKKLKSAISKHLFARKDLLEYTSNPQPIGFSGILLAKRQNSFYCTYFLHNRNVADTKSPYPIKRLEVIRWFNQKSMVFNQSLS